MKRALKKLKRSKIQSNTVFIALCTAEAVLTTLNHDEPRFIPESLLLQLAQQNQMTKHDKICVLMWQEFYDKYWEKDSENGLFQRLSRIDKSFQIYHIIMPPIEPTGIFSIGLSADAINSIFSSVLKEIQSNQRIIILLPEKNFVPFLRLSMIIMMYTRFKYHIKEPTMYMAKVDTGKMPIFDFQEISVTEDLEMYLENLEWAMENHLFPVTVELIEDVLVSQIFAPFLSNIDSDERFPMQASTTRFVKSMMEADPATLERLRPLQDPRVNVIDFYLSLDKQELELFKETMLIESLSKEDQKTLVNKVIHHLKTAKVNSIRN